ncbi:hypothetical protein IQ07DRAFT_375289 [Pyrenochaeta sp. DS3sAY3a]|nr:hypothetical protein IQ07DRAFT_375289 [Pyrenochaeta sp. DS3sAY3a]
MSFISLLFRVIFAVRKSLDYLVGSSTKGNGIDLRALQCCAHGEFALASCLFVPLVFILPLAPLFKQEIMAALHWRIPLAPKPPWLRRHSLCALHQLLDASGIDIIHSSLSYTGCARASTGRCFGGWCRVVVRGLVAASRRCRQEVATRWPAGASPRLLQGCTQVVRGLDVVG